MTVEVNCLHVDCFACSSAIKIQIQIQSGAQIELNLGVGNFLFRRSHKGSEIEKRKSLFN